MSSIGRPAHILKPEKTVTIPRYFIFFDTETKQHEKSDKTIVQNFKLGWACFYQRPFGRHREKTNWIFFDSEDAFWDFVFANTRPKQKVWLLARNIVFDFTVVKGWEFLRQEGYKLKFFHNNGVSAIISVIKEDRSIVFLDTMNWFVESIEATGKRIGLPKLKIDFDNCTIEELTTYCYRDVEIDFENFKLFLRFLSENSLGRLCYTRASTAMSTFLRRHYKTNIYIHNNKEAIKLERNSYKGGRCECYYLGDFNNETYYVLDVNSLYPYVMRNGLFPVRYSGILYNVTMEDLQSALYDHTIIAKVLIETDEPIYGIKRDRLIFPIGLFTTTLTTPELKYALEHNHIKHIYSMVVYQQANIFMSYVDTFYQLRQRFKTEGIYEYDEICKKMLNSLYGKFGQKAEKWVKIGEAPAEPDRTELIFYPKYNKRTKIMYLLGEVFVVKGYSESFNSFPAIASHVTAYGRMYLWYLIQKAGELNCYYCDTDSIIVNEDGLLNLAAYIDNTELGKLKVEEKTQHLTIRGLKDYTTDTKQAIKGIRKNAVCIKQGIYEQQSWPSFNGVLRTGNANTYEIKTTTKHLSREYTKGVVTETGHINPFIICETII